MWVVGVEVDLELTGDRRPRNQGFPVLWSRGLAKERSRRKLGTWRNFWYGGFGNYGEKLANRLETVSLLTRRSWRPGKEESEARRREK